MRRVFFELRYLLGRPPWDTGITPPEVLAFLERTPPGRALDLGCGTGTNAVELARRGWEVTAIDFSHRAVAAARQRAAAARLPVDVRQGDVSDLRGVQGPFDLVLDIGCSTPCRRKPRPATPPASSGARSRRHVPAVHLLDDGLAPQGGRALPTEDSLRRLFTPAFAVTTIDYGTDRQRASALFTFLRTG
jgi:SAM-dependent methyltransferase